MGVVYRARHLTSDSIVALKTVRVPAPRWLASIRREVQALTRIRHPGIVRILDHGLHEGRPWYAMDLLEGETLRHYCRRIWSPFQRSSFPPPQPTETANATEDVQASSTSVVRELPSVEAGAQWGTQSPAGAGELAFILRTFHRLCTTLAFLHGEGLVNCDLKPENVLLVNAAPILIDFGLTAHSPRAGREWLDSQRSFAGTVPYMSPEQIRGEFVDARSDLYSLGCMLYELVTGEPPFSGPGVIGKHLDEAVRPPSSRASGVSEQLDRLILKLLDKGLSGRFGFADEVAADLAALADCEPLSEDLPPPSPYLYRPGFVGREKLLELIIADRDRTLDGSGALLMLGGDSGAGKTRVAMESTRVPPSYPMRVITSEVASVFTENRDSTATEPLHVLRPVLQAIADECQHGGAEVTERLLGASRAVLALYEPMLADVPTDGELHTPLPLVPSAFRKQLFEFLASALRAFSQELPILWVIDDLGWADELSLSFLHSLDAAFFDNTALLILCTHRTEENNPQLDQLAALPHVRHHRLARLEHSAIRSMVSDMLALSEPESKLVEFVTREADGNPFFVSEYLRATVDARILSRNLEHSWTFSGQATDEYTLESLGLPATLRDVIEQRLIHLSPGARETCFAAALLGRESETEVLRAISELSEEASLAALDELLRRNVLVQAEPETVRFAHDKVREVAYGQLETKRRVVLHGRAAFILEARWRDRAGAQRAWPALGQHFAVAQQHDRAAQYLRMAADHARSTHANYDAIRLYQDAILQTREFIAAGPASPASESSLTRMHESLADVMTLTGQRQEARVAYDWALERTASDEASSTARLLRKLGKTWEMEHRHEEALSHYAKAQRASEAHAQHPASDLRDEWIQAHIEQLWVYYWLARVADMNALVAALEPQVRSYGSAFQHARFFQVLVLANLRRSRFLPDEVTLGYSRAAVLAARNPSARIELPMAQFLLAFALQLGGSVIAAETELLAAETLARRAGDAGLLARCLTYLTVSARIQGKVDEAKTRAETSLSVANAGRLREYIAAALANQAWIALRERSPDRAFTLAHQALEIWASLALVFPFQALALVPLLEITLGRGELAQAVGHAEALLSPGQQILRGAASDTLARACEAWRANDANAARRELNHALRHLDATLSST